MNFTRKYNKEYWSNKLAKLPVIMITGDSGSGKTYLSRLLKMYLNEKEVSTTILSFSGAIESLAEGYFRWDGMKDSRGVELIESLKIAGMEYYPDIWSEILNNIVQDTVYNSNIGCIIIDDWSYANEYEVLDKMDLYYLYSIRVIRADENTESKESICSAKLVSHDDSFDYVFDNSANYIKLYIETQVDSIVKDIL